MDNGNGKQARFKMSVDTLRLIEGLSQAEYHQIASYSNLSELIGRDVQKEGAGILRSALNCLERDYGMFFSCITGQGVMRITESEHLQSAPVMTREKIRRASSRGKKRLSHLRDNTLSREEQTKKLEEMSYLGTLEDFAKEKKAAEVPVRPQAPANASKKALDLFKKK